MRINKIILENFRGYKNLELSLNETFNLIVGENGSGKTAILEGLTIAMGSFFLGIRNVNSRGILNKDIHISTYEGSEEYVFPVKINAHGVVNNQTIAWSRTLSGLKNRTTSSRLFDQARENEKVSKKSNPVASRFRAYRRCLEAKSTYNQFQKWYKGKELAKIQKGAEDIALALVKKAIIENIPGCVNIFHEFDPDKQQGLKIELSDGRILPFYALSDGTRNFFAIVADLAYKCVTLNPYLKEKALHKTEGIVLIDELDLHLHPGWQRRIIATLRNTFPCIQFIATTHSPFLIQETAKQELIILEHNKAARVGCGIHMSIEDIAEEIQKVENPQWSKSRQIMFEKAGKYYRAVKDGEDTQEMKNDLDKAMKPFALDASFYAMLEQERIKAEYKKNKEK